MSEEKMKCPTCGTHMIAIPEEFERDTSELFKFWNNIKWERQGDWYCPICVNNRFYWNPVKID